MHNEGSSLVVAHRIMGNITDLYCEMYGIIVVDPRKVNMLQSRLAIHLTQYLTNATTSRSVSIHNNCRGCRQRNRGLQKRHFLPDADLSCERLLAVVVVQLLLLRFHLRRAAGW
jgi:hypothetical protein